MKVTIWQQFNSNNSSSFTIVGEFRSRQDAEHAATELHKIFQMLSEWHKIHEAEMEDWWASGDWIEEPSLLERELGHQYGIEWKNAIDWFDNYKIETVLDRFLYVTYADFSPDGSGKPVDKLMEALGGKGYLESNVYGTPVAWILFNLTCIAPDETKAYYIYRKYLGINRRIILNGLHLQFDRWRFDDGFDLSDLIRELKETGCTNIDYQFVQFYPPEGTYGDEYPLHTADDIDMLIAILQYAESSFDRRDATNLLAELGDQRVVEPLIAALNDSYKGVRAGAAIALGWLGDTHALETVKLALNDLEADVRESAISAVSRLGGSQAFDLLLPMLQDPAGNVRRVAAWHLGGTKDERAYVPLIKFLEDNNVLGRGGAISGLGALGDPRAIPYLLQALQDENRFIWDSAASALAHLGATAMDDIQKFAAQDTNKTFAERLHEIESYRRMLNPKNNSEG